MPLSKIQAINGQVTPNLGRRNLVINGDMRIAQRGTSHAYSNGQSGLHTLDRWWSSNSSNGTLTLSQQTATLGEVDATHYLRTVTSGISGSPTVYSEYKIEDIKQFHNKPITISFMVKGSSALTFQLRRHYYYGSGGTSEEYTGFTDVSVTTGWTKFTTTFSAVDFSSKTIGASNYFGFLFYWSTSQGSNQVNNATIEITNVQVETNNTATNFEHRSIGEELQLCQRYYQEYRPCGQEWVYNEGATATHKWWQNPIKVPMRGTPTTTHTGITGAALMGSTVSSLTRQGVSADRCSWRVTLAGAAGDANKLYHTDQFDQDYIHMDAEL